MISTKLLAVVALSSSLIASTNAACNQNCNGHGTCGAFDRCTCYHGWDYSGAEDCSQRVCPYGKAWASIGDTVHTYAECSNQGDCNRELGTCECNEGFTGSSCQRSSCPKSCSGHGQCQTLETWTSLDSSVSTYSGWDADKIMVCKCDPGYEMADCSKRMCPFGDDPLSLGQSDSVHTLTFDDAVIVGNQFALQFTDWTGMVHNTHLITVVATMAENNQLIQEALQALPNNVVPSVAVGSAGDIASSAVFTVTFTASENSGEQVPLGVISSGLTDVGNQPVVGTVLAGAITVTTVAGSEESKVCAGRGICDAEQGLCACNVGFYGHSCDKQTALQ